MTAPTVTLTRRVLQLATGDVNYEITAQVTDPGDLPFVELFLVTIGDPSSEKADVLARVVTPLELREDTGTVYVRVDASSLVTISGDAFAAVADITTLTSVPRDRTTAIQRGGARYLTSTVSLSYADVTSATAAYQTLLSRLSTLVNDWRSFSTAFATAPTQAYALPQPGIGVEDQLTAAYTAAVAARKSAETVRDGLQAQKDACSAQDAANLALFGMLTADIAFLQAAKQTVTGLVETGTLVGGTPAPGAGTYTIAPSNTAKTFCLNAGDARSYEALLVAKNTQWTALRDAIAAHDAACGAVTRQLLDAQVAVDSAKAVENTALANVLAVCPTFQPVTS